MVLNLDGALSRGRTGDHRLEGALQVQPRQTASAVVAHNCAVACVADAGASTADSKGARLAVHGTGEGSGVVGLERAIGVEDGDALRVIHASLQKCRPITAEIVVVNGSIGRR